MRFWGQYELKLDKKGRAKVPSPIRDPLLKEGIQDLIVTMQENNGRYCLEIVPLPVWQDFMERFEKLPKMDPHVQNIQTIHVVPAQPVTMDAQNRILIPQRLREKIELEREAVAVAAGDRFQLWKAEVWEEVQSKASAGFAEAKQVLAEKL